MNGAMDLDESGLAQANERRAALALHAMARDDRDWILAELPVADRDQLTALLDDLTRLGVPADRGLLDLMRQEAAGRTAGGFEASGPVGSQAGRGSRATVAKVSALAPEVVSHVLRRESVALIASVLAISPWPWKAAFLGKLEPRQARRIADELSTRSASRASGVLRDEAILAALLHKAEQHRSQAVPRPLAGQAPKREGMCRRVTGWLFRKVARGAAL